MRVDDLDTLAILGAVTVLALLAAMFALADWLRHRR